MARKVGLVVIQLMSEAWRYDPRRATLRQVEAARSLLVRRFRRTSR